VLSGDIEVGRSRRDALKDRGAFPGVTRPRFNGRDRMPHDSDLETGTASVKRARFCNVEMMLLMLCAWGLGTQPSPGCLQ
jgi:hypothetical protein